MKITSNLGSHSRAIARREAPTIRVPSPAGISLNHSRAVARPGYARGMMPQPFARRRPPWNIHQPFARRRLAVCVPRVVPVCLR